MTDEDVAFWMRGVSSVGAGQQHVHQVSHAAAARAREADGERADFTGGGERPNHVFEFPDVLMPTATSPEPPVPDLPGEDLVVAVVVRNRVMDEVFA